MQIQNDQENEVEPSKSTEGGCGFIFFLIIVIAFITVYIGCSSGAIPGPRIGS